MRLLLFVSVLAILGLTTGYRILAIIPCYNGHAESMKGVVRELETRGNEVRVHFSHYCPHMMYEGFTGKLTFGEKMKRDSDIALGDIFSGMYELMLMWTEGMNDTVQETLKVMENEPSFDVVYGDFWMMGAMMVAEAQRVPAVVNAISGFNFGTRSILEDEYDAFRSIFQGPDIIVDAIVYWMHYASYTYLCNFMGTLRKGLDLPELPYSPPKCAQEYLLRFPGVIPGGEPFFIPENKDSFYKYTGFVSNEPSVTLPKKLRQWVEKSEISNNIVLISFGSFVSMDDRMATELLHAIAVRRTGLRFIWTFKYVEQMKRLKASVRNLDQEKILLSGLLPHSQWVTVQRDRRILTFVTHCGLNTAFELIDAELPAIGVAAFGDQNVVALRFERLGYGVRLNIDTFTVQNFFDAIENVRENTSTYKKNLNRIRERLREYGGYANGAEIIESVGRNQTLPKDFVMDLDTPLVQRMRRNAYIFLVAFAAGVIFLISISAMCIFRFLNSNSIHRNKQD